VPDPWSATSQSAPQAAESVPSGRRLYTPASAPRDAWPTRDADLKKRPVASRGDVLSLLSDYPGFLKGGPTRAASPRTEIVFPEVPRVLGARAELDTGSGAGSLGLGQLPAVALTLVFLASLLIVGSLLPPSVVARTPVPVARFARLRQPLALAAVGILIPLAVLSTAAALA
jgi:hypothetical protein